MYSIKLSKKELYLITHGKYPVNPINIDCEPRVWWFAWRPVMAYDSVKDIFKLTWLRKVKRKEIWDPFHGPNSFTITFYWSV